MSRIVFNRILIIIAMSLVPLLPASLPAGQDEDQSRREIFQWVAHELGIPKQYPIPEISFVSKKTLQNVLRDKAGEDLEGLVGIYGDSDPEAMKRHYLRNILGLFLPKTGEIYVLKGLKPCRQGSIIAHEFTHYYQVMLYGRTGSLRPHEQEEIHIFREAEASEVEKQFLRQFCR